MKTREIQGSTIMVVDDDAINNKIACNMLTSMFQVISVSSGREVFEKLEKQIPDMILLDVHMPEMDGYEVIRVLKAHPDYNGIPVIFLTADDDFEAEGKGFEEGALDFITKPYKKEIVLRRISRILELDYLQKNLEEEVEKQTEKAVERQMKLERLSLQTINTLAKVIDAKDPYTNGHSIRVAEYSVMLAEKMGYSEEELTKVRYVALLHDIGKIGISDDIINKVSGLTSEEYGVIRAHPMIGGKILRNITEIPDIAIGARWHHERFDGTGYPDRLKGEMIPEIVRIIGVADAYDAMTSKRCYQDIKSQEEARAEILAGRGSQFDPRIADFMLEMIDEDTEYLMHE